MGEFSDRDEAFFRSGETLSAVPEAPTWWDRLFRPELRGWSPLPYEAGEGAEPDYYAAYEVIFDDGVDIAA